MKFACDNCSAQYMIADEKLGPNGVKVRCKKCAHEIIVRPPERGPAAAEPEEDPGAAQGSATGTEAQEPAAEGGGADATVVMSNPLAGLEE
ncbi:MAG: gliding motility protein, partial [Deltaproteobacteria bacterium]